MAGAAAEKNANYSALLNMHVFVPIALETLGPINVTGQNFLQDLCRKLTTATGDDRETCFLLQHLSITIQRFAGHGGALVESIAFNRRVVGSTPSLAAM